MKIVHSYWSKPSLKKEKLNNTDRNKGGWVDKKYNYMSWALSCLQFKKHYSRIELVTDSEGYELLINKLELPYSKVDVCLDDLNGYHSDLWALGKIYAYSIQKEPFIHADGDIFIYDRFGKANEESDLIVQSDEQGFEYYQDIFNAIKENFTYIPEALFESEYNNHQINAINAGILGGVDIDFFNSYTKEAFKFVDENLHKLNKINIGMFNCIFEQFLFNALAEKKEKKIKYYLDNVNCHCDGLADFTGLPNKTKYIHTVGSYKAYKYIGELLAYRLLADYPDYYYKIINLIRTNQI